MSAGVRRDFPGGLTASEFVAIPRTDPEVMRDLKLLMRAYNRLRHDRESAALVGEAVGVSRESLRKMRHLRRHPDLDAAVRSGTASLEECYRQACERSGRPAPSRRTTVPVDDAPAAVTALLRHYSGEDLLQSLTQVLGYGGGAR